MKPEYEAWIKANVKENPLGECKRMAEAMAAAFPELRVVRGHYYCMVWGERGHWWCETSDHEVVDPTAAQFPTLGAGVYAEFTGLDSELPTGRCSNCGEACYNHANFCSDACGRAWVKMLNTAYVDDLSDH